jgi:hypothetical protein
MKRTLYVKKIPNVIQETESRYYTTIIDMFVPVLMNLKLNYVQQWAV